jgi:electron transport complex protein RnfC
MNLMPMRLAIAGNKRDDEESKRLNVSDCSECGSCSFICPAKIPLAQIIKMSKETEE